MGNSDSSSVKQYIPETWSRCSTESDTVAHSFEVTNFSLLEGMGAGNFIRSSTFSAGGCEWDIKFYPDGWMREDKGAYTSAFLCFCRGEPVVKTKYTLSLLDEHGRVSTQVSLEHAFKSIGCYWGYGQFVRKSKLQRLLSCNDDGFTIRCVLTVMKKHHTEDVSTFIVPTPPSNLHEDFGKMLKGEEGADVRFSVGDQSFCAHRCVLAARSPVFKAELFGQMKEMSGTQHIKIDDMEPSIFEALLHFVYTDTLPDNCDVKKAVILQHLLVAADRYELDRLVTMCEGKLCQSIDVQTIATTLTLAEQHGRMRLKNACIRFVSSQDVLSAVKETDGFKHLMASCPLVMVDILEQKLPPSEVAWSQPRMTPGSCNRQRHASWARRVVFLSAGVLVVVSSVGLIIFRGAWMRVATVLQGVETRQAVLGSFDLLRKIDRRSSYV